MKLDGDTSFLGEDDLVCLVKGKKVFYAATTYTDYLRVQQEIQLLKKHAATVTVVTYSQSSYALRVLQLYLYLLFNRFSEYEIVFFGFAPQLIVPVWGFKFRGSLVISDFFISFYDTLVDDRRKFKRGSYVARLLSWFDSRTVALSDYIVSDTEAHAEYFCKSFGARNSSTFVLYLEADSKYYYPKIQRKPDFLADRFVVLYFGSVIPLQGLEVVVAAVSSCAKVDQLYFVMIGPLSVEHRVELAGCDNVICFDWMDQYKLSEWISVSDLCLAGHFSGEIKKAKRTIPGKAYIYEAMGKRMILGDNVANRERYPSEYSDVGFVNMGSSADLKAKVLEELYSWNEK